MAAAASSEFGFRSRTSKPDIILLAHDVHRVEI